MVQGDLEAGTGNLENGVQLKTGNIAFPGISFRQWKLREVRDPALFTTRMEHKWSTRGNGYAPETYESGIERHPSNYRRSIGLRTYQWNTKRLATPAFLSLDSALEP